MAIIKSATYAGDMVTGSNDGKIIIDQSNGEMVVRDQNNVRRYYLGSKRSPLGFGLYISSPGVDVVEELNS